MNPLRWKRDHQIALALSMCVGAAIGLWLSWHQIWECGSMYRNGYGQLVDLGGFAMGCFSQWFLKPLLWAVIGGAGVFIRQLLRA
jgi:hypothetical protein